MPVSLCLPIPVCVAGLIETRRALEQFFCDIRAIAVEPVIVFEGGPRQPDVAFETAKKAAKIDDCVSNLAADALYDEMIDGSNLLAIRAINGGSLYVSAGDQAFAASRCVFHDEVLH